MTDINSSPLPHARQPGPTPGRTDDAPKAIPDQDKLIAFAELLYFAYRDFTGDADAVLTTYSFGRAHHRVLHFVHRNPGLKVAELLDILRITKQSLARVLKELSDKHFIARRKGTDDQRERRLYTTTKGARLAEKLTVMQVKRIHAALAEVGPEGDDTVRRFLLAMIEPADRSSAVTSVKWPKAATDVRKNK